MGKLLEAVSKQIHDSKDPELAYVLNELSDNLAECDTVEKGFKHTPSMVIILKSDDPNCGAKYMIDMDSLKKYADDQNKPINAAYKQVLYDNNIAEEDAGVFVNNVNMEGIYDYIINSPTPEIKHERTSAISSLSTDINTLRMNNIRIIKSLS